VRGKNRRGASRGIRFCPAPPDGEMWTSELAERFPAATGSSRASCGCRGASREGIGWGRWTPLRRYIYIHGSPENVEMGKPGSIGCIRNAQPGYRGAFRARAAGDRG